uniref:separase n=1 Tax=Culicoides sonorensis TaxID=179676 RepID=A0A336N0S1_CULSO
MKTVHKSNFELARNINKAGKQLTISNLIWIMEDKNQNYESKFDRPVEEQIANINNLLYEAEKLIENGDFKSAIVCATEALSSNAKIKYNFDPDRANISWDKKELCKKIINMNNISNDSKPVLSREQLFTELHKNLSKLPEEWMVIQIAKRFDRSVLGATNRKITSKDTGLLITLFRYPRWELNDKKPLVIVVPPNDGDNMLKRIGDLYYILKENLIFDKEKDAGEYRQKYWVKLKEIENDFQNLITAQEKWFGNWRFLLSSSFKEKDDIAMESKIYAKVDTFCEKQKFSTEFRILLSLIGRRIDLMSSEAIYGFCCHFAENKDDLKKIFMFLIDIQKSFEIKSPRESYPCILVIDEMLDFLLWEMLNTDQDFTRFNSFHVLMTLFTKHCNEIKNGYWHTNIKKGFAIVDPEKNLPTMQERLMEYFNYWMPQWKKLVAQAPTKELFADILTNYDVFTYCGHGSGLQFIKEYYLTFLRIRPVTFLFGCGSGKLNSKGMWSEMQGSHTYYAAGLCPTVFGMLFVVTDYLTDLMASIILCRWIPNPDCKRSWRDTFKKNWRPESHNEKTILNSDPEHNLCRIITDLRRELSITIRQRAAMCLRGLPVWNNF